MKNAANFLEFWRPKLQLKQKIPALSCITSQNGQTHFKNLAAFSARFFKVSDYFGTLYFKWLIFFQAIASKSHKSALFGKE